MNLPFRLKLEQREAGAASGLARVPDEMVKLYYAIESMRAHREPAVLQFVAATSGQGTSTIASMLARIAAASGSQSVLLLDCGAARPIFGGARTVIDAFRAGLPLQQAATHQPRGEHHRLAQLSNLPRHLLDLGPEGLRDLFDALRQGFDITILDSPAVRQSPDAVGLSRYCDATILVVQAEAATIDSVQAARREIEQAGGQVVGTVLNRQRQHIPRWLLRRL